MDALSTTRPLSPEHAAAVALIRAGNRTHNAMEEAARTRLGFLHLTKDGQASTHSDRVFAKLAHGRFCRPQPTTISGPLDALRQTFVDCIKEVNMYASKQATTWVAFAKISPNKPPEPDAKARKAAADNRKGNNNGSNGIPSQS
jgi:hypothetical protein